MNQPAYIILSIPVFLAAISFHEFAHAYTAVLLGDPTPKLQGRLTLNFMAHLSFTGIIALLLAGIGWAKPVLVAPERFRNPNGGMLLVSLAGPLANVVLAVIFALTFRLMGFAGPLLYALDERFVGAVALLLLIGVQLNLMLALFNLLPVPPLDGSRILLTVLPDHWTNLYVKVEPYAFLVLFILLRFGGLGDVLYTLTYQGMEFLIDL